MSAVEALAARIEAALLVEYPWHDHDCWTSDEEVRRMGEAGDDPWPHLKHVAAVAAEAALDDLGGRVNP